MRASVFASRADGMTALMLGSAAGYGVELLPAFLHDATEHDGHRTMPAHLKRQESALTVHALGTHLLSSAERANLQGSRRATAMGARR